MLNTVIHLQKNESGIADSVFHSPSSKLNFHFHFHFHKHVSFGLEPVVSTMGFFNSNLC